MCTQSQRRYTALSITAILIVSVVFGASLAAQDHPTTQEQQTGITQNVAHRNVVINGARISDEDLNAIAARWNVRVGDGDYWYDRRCGAWGITGGPTVGFVLPNIAIGGEL